MRRMLKGKATKEMQVKFYKVMAVPTLLYGNEVWITNQKQQNLITLAEMKFLRSVRGCSRIDGFQNVDIKNDLNVTSIIKYIENHRERWCEHLERMDLNRLPAIVHRYRREGR
jgi:hypothetical protein